MFLSLFAPTTDGRSGGNRGGFEGKDGVHKLDEIRELL